MKAPECVGRKRGLAKTKKVTIVPKKVVVKDSEKDKERDKEKDKEREKESDTEKDTFKAERKIVGGMISSGHESGDNASVGQCAGILKTRDNNTPCQVSDPCVIKGILQLSPRTVGKSKPVNAKKPPKFSPTRSSIIYIKTKSDDKVNQRCQSLEGQNVSVENKDQSPLNIIEKGLSPSLCTPNFLPTEKNETPELVALPQTPELVAPPPPGYFIRDDLSTDEEQTIICCNQHGVRILDNVPLCTFGYQGWSAMPCYREMSPECDSNLSPHSLHSQSPGMKKKEPTAKKTKKTKKRKRSTSKPRDQSDFSLRKIFVDGNIKNRMKPEVDLKKGIALKQGSKKENVQTLRYKQKVINPKNPKLFQTMGNLPVSMDSVLYYYEPRGNQGAGKIKKKSFTSGKNNSRKITSKKKQISCKNKQEDLLSLNTNANANTSDIDLTEIKNVKGFDTTPAQSCTRQNGNTHLPNSFDTDLCDAVGNILPGDYSSLYFEDLDSDFKRRILSDGGTKENNRDAGELGKTIETPNDPFSIETMVDDFIQNAYKEETEYEQLLMPEKIEYIPKQKEENVDTLTTIGGNLSMLNMTCKSHKVASKKSTISEKEKSKIQDRPLTKMVSKVTHPKLDVQTNSLRQMKKKSLSTPNIAIARSERGESAISDVENVMPSPMTSMLQAQKEKSEFENPLCRSQTSPQLAHITANSMEINNAPVSHKNEPMVDSMMDDNVSLQLNDYDYTDMCKQKDRGRMKKSCPKTNSILRKPSTSSQDEKRIQSTKAQIKAKPFISFTKSHSLSPIAKKRVGQSNLGQPSSKKSKDSGDILKKSGKKLKKKVRIVVDVNGIQPGKIQTDDDFCEFRDDSIGQHGGFDDEIDDNHAYLAGLLERCKTENERFQNEEFDTQHRKIEMSQDSDTQNEKGDSCDLAYCGFSETNSDQESLPNSPQGREVMAYSVKTTKEKKHKKTQKQMEREHKEKMQAAERERLQAEKGWDNNFMVQKEDSKTKVVLKRKRYQLKKAGDQKCEIDDISLLEKLRNSTDVDIGCKRVTSQTGNKFLKGPSSKKRPYSPKQSAKRGNDRSNFDQDPRDGTSVDAPGFNKKEFGVRSTKSGQSVCISKQSTKESFVNPNTTSMQAQRVKMARDNFPKVVRKRSPSPLGDRYTSSMVDQVSPMASRSTDLDAAFSCRRQQLSPGRINAIGRLTRRDSKLCHGSKYRSKSESEEYKQKLVAVCVAGTQGHDSERLQHSDPMDMNVINLGLSWVFQGLIKKLSIFNKKEENEDSQTSPVKEDAYDLEATQI